MPINSSPGVAEEEHGPGDIYDAFGDWLGDYFNDSFFSPGGRQDVGGSDWFGVSVGLANLSLLGRQGTVVPPLVSIPTITPQITIPPPPPFNGSEVVEFVSWRDYMATGAALPADWGNYAGAHLYPGLLAGSGDADGGMIIEDDDVSILGDLYDQLDTSLGGWLPGGVPIGTGGPSLNPVAGAAYNFPAPGTAVGPPLAPGVVPIPGTGGPVNCAPTMIFNSKTGKWTKKRKRRRRQLATRSDIRDLSALKGVLGLGKNLEVWIATHS